MPKKKEEKIEIRELKAPPPPVLPIFSNVSLVNAHPDFAVIDFGLLAPSYQEPYDLEDSQIARICLSWDAAKVLVESLGEAISELKKEQKAKRKSKSK